MDPRYKKKKILVIGYFILVNIALMSEILTEEINFISMTLMELLCGDLNCLNIFLFRMKELDLSNKIE